MKLFRISTIPLSLNILLKGQLNYLNQFYEVTAISGAGKDLDEVREREGVKTHSIAIERKISPWKDGVSLWKLYWYFRKEKPDLIHSITPKAGLLSMIAGKLAGVPVRIHTFTGLIFPHKEGYFQLLLIWMDRLLCRFATHIFPEGEGVKQDLLGHRITGKPLKIIANGNVNGIHLGYFSRNQISADEAIGLQKKLGFSEGDFVFSFIGRLARDKGVNELVSAFSVLVRKYPNIKLLLIGPSEQALDPVLPETLEIIETHPGIVSTGFQEDVRPFLAVTDVFVLPSYREGFPNAVLQSLAMEVPVIGSDINGCREIIMHGENGVLVSVRNNAALSALMEKLYVDQCLRQKLKSNSRASVQKFSQDLVWKGLLEEYRAICH